MGSVMLSKAIAKYFVRYVADCQGHNFGDLKQLLDQEMDLVF